MGEEKGLIALYMPKKFLAFYDNLQLRLEELSEHSWQCYVLEQPVDYGYGPSYSCERFTACSEQDAKQGAEATIRNRFPKLKKELVWRDLSDISDKEWRDAFKEYFPPEKDATT